MIKPPYKTDKNVWFTQSLFWDKWIHLQNDLRQDFAPIYTLYSDKPGYICARTTFVELNDPTGYKWAMKYLGDYEHWKYLMKAKWFREAYDVWIDELKTKLRSEALDTIKTIATNGQPAQALVAAKYLASFEWEKASRGRPSKAEIQGELKRAAKAFEVEDDDAQRIGLRIIK